MNQSVEEILRSHYVDGALHTHVSMVQPRGKFQFNRQGLEEFWDTYCQRLLTDKNHIMGVAEKPQHYLPVLVDVDLKVKDDGNIEFGDHLYTPEQTKLVIEIYQSVLRTIVDQCTDDHLLCVLLEKPMYYITTGETIHAKNGFHLHFPNLFLSKIDQEIQLIPRVQEAMTDYKVFENLGYLNSADAIDKACCKVPWLMYGSRKSEDMDPYTVTKVFDADAYEIDLEDAFKSYRLYDLHEKPIKIVGRVIEYLPRILSVIPYGRTTSEVRQGLTSPLKMKIVEERITEKKYLQVSVIDTLKISAKLLPLLADFRCEDRNEWLKIGYALNNIGDSSTEALDQWMTFSSRSDEKYEESTCIYEWERMIKRDVPTIGTLHHFAKLDNPELYEKFKQEQSSHFVADSLNGSHNDIAKIMHAEYSNEFVCASIANKVWYQFINHRWEEIEEGVFLRSRISEEIVKKYTALAHDIVNKQGAAADKPEANMYEARNKQIGKMISNLKSAPFKNHIMKEAMEIFYDRRFKGKLDQNPYLIGFQNGIYDLKLCKFRQGCPEDFISKCIPIDYKEYDESSDEVQNIIEFLQKVFPDSSIRTYFLDTYSDIFVGGNSQKKVYLWTGEGDNAKSITQSFFEKMLGELAIKFNTQYFTGKKTSTGSANPELARAAPPVRHATMEEPDADEQLNIGELKKLSGGDSYWARDLFEKGKSTREVFPMFTITFICLDGDTPISLSSGVSIALKNMQQRMSLFEVFTWNSEKMGIVNSTPNKFLDKGIHDTITLTLGDNRKITCTPDHKFLTKDDVWIEAKNIVCGVTQLRMGPLHPMADDIFEESRYVINNSFNLHTLPNKLRCMALCRLLGYTYKSGSAMLTNPQSGSAMLTIDYRIDSIPIIQDIYSVTGKVPTIKQHDNSVHISLSGLNLDLYQFIFDDDCPLFLVREFIGAVFGRYSEFNERSGGPFTGLTSSGGPFTGLTLSGYDEVIELLQTRFSISLSGLIKFGKNVGFRYCTHKTQKMANICSCQSYKEAIYAQNSWITDRTRFLVLCEGLSLEDTLNNVKNEYRAKNEFISERYMITSDQIEQNDIDQEIDLSEFLFKTGLYNKTDMVYQSFYMEVVGIKKSGQRHVYDLNMDEKYSNFIAAGIVTHNCNKLPKLKYSDKATWNRLRVIPFESTFVDSDQPCPATFEEQILQKRFPMDKTFSQKIPGMVTAFAWYLLQWRQKVTIRIEPEKVREATAVYRRQNDIYRQFIEECIIEDDKNSVTLTEIYVQFKEWYKEGWSNMSIPIKNEVKEYFERLWGETDRGCKWDGYRIRSMADNSMDGAAGNDLGEYTEDGRALPPM